MQVLDKNTHIGLLSLSILVGGYGSWVFSGECGGCDVLVVVVVVVSVVVLLGGISQPPDI